jgi:hypothetical protein
MLQLSVSPNFAIDHSVGVSSANAIQVSQDAGRTFTPVPLPGPVSSGGITLAANGTGVAGMWFMAQLASHSWTIFRSDDRGQSWFATGSNRSLATEGGTVVAVDPDRTIVKLTQGGLLCSVNNGATWASRCPAA